MDTAICLDGDFAVDDQHRLCRITGKAELAQQLYIRLSAVRNGFWYDRKLGSGIAQVDLNATDAVQKIEAEARKALADMAQAEVTGVQISGGTVTVFVCCRGEEFSIDIRRGNEFE